MAPHTSPLDNCRSSLFLNELTDSLLITSSERAFHEFAIRLRKKLCLGWHDCTNSRLSCFRLGPRDVDHVGLFNQLISSNSCIILYICIRSPRRLLNSSVVSFILSHRSSYFSPFRGVGSLVTLLWTFSIVEMSRFRKQFQDETENSSCGRMYVRYKEIHVSTSLDIKVRFSIPKIDDAFDAERAAWALNLKSGVKIIPRSRSSRVFVKVVLLPSLSRSE